MYASKENARKAREMVDGIVSVEGLPAGGLTFLEEFLTVAERKLPTEAAYRRDEKRRKTTKTKA